MKYMDIKRAASELRRNPTGAEKKMWSILRMRQFEGEKFIRQHPMRCVHDGKEYFFVADFYCAKHRLDLELDGEIHDFQKSRDKERRDILRENRIMVLRVRNEEVHNTEEVLNKIKKALI